MGFVLNTCSSDINLFNTDELHFSEELFILLLIFYA